MPVDGGLLVVVVVVVVVVVLTSPSIAPYHPLPAAASGMTGYDSL
jgi:hypothetical protein